MLVGPQWDQSTGHSTGPGEVVVGQGLEGVGEADAASLGWLSGTPLSVYLARQRAALIFGCNTF